MVIAGAFVEAFFQMSGEEFMLLFSVFVPKKYDFDKSEQIRKKLCLLIVNNLFTKALEKGAFCFFFVTLGFKF